MVSNLLAVSIPSIIMMVAVVALLVVWMVYSNRSQKKRQQERSDTLGAIKPGNKVKTIGGICGVVVEVCPEDNTFVLETGTEASGKSYIKFDKEAVYQTDAVVEKPAENAAATPAEDAFAEEEPKAETDVNEVKEEAPAEEASKENE